MTKKIRVALHVKNGEEEDFINGFDFVGKNLYKLHSKAKFLAEDFLIKNYDDYTKIDIISQDTDKTDYDLFHSDDLNRATVFDFSKNINGHYTMSINDTILSLAERIESFESFEVDMYLSIMYQRYYDILEKDEQFDVSVDNIIYTVGKYFEELNLARNVDVYDMPSICKHLFEYEIRFLGEKYSCLFSEEYIDVDKVKCIFKDGNVTIQNGDVTLYRENESQTEDEIIQEKVNSFEISLKCNYFFACEVEDFLSTLNL